MGYDELLANRKNRDNPKNASYDNLDTLFDKLVETKANQLNQYQGRELPKYDSQIVDTSGFETLVSESDNRIRRELEQRVKRYARKSETITVTVLTESDDIEPADTKQQQQPFNRTPALIDQLNRTTIKLKQLEKQLNIPKHDTESVEALAYRELYQSTQTLAFEYTSVPAIYENESHTEDSNVDVALKLLDKNTKYIVGSKQLIVIRNLFDYIANYLLLGSDATVYTVAVDDKRLVHHIRRIDSLTITDLLKEFVDRINSSLGITIRELFATDIDFMRAFVYLIKNGWYRLLAYLHYVLLLARSFAAYFTNKQLISYLLKLYEQSQLRELLFSTRSFNPLDYSFYIGLKQNYLKQLVNRASDLFQADTINTIEAEYGIPLITYIDLVLRLISSQALFIRFVLPVIDYLESKLLGDKVAISANKRGYIRVSYQSVESRAQPTKQFLSHLFDLIRIIAVSDSAQKPAIPSDYLVVLSMTIWDNGFDSLANLEYLLYQSNSAEIIDSAVFEHLDTSHSYLIRNRYRLIADMLEFLL